MKITHIETLCLRIPGLRDDQCDGTQDTIIVKVHTDEGLVGIGEADTIPTVAAEIIHAPPSHSIARGLKHVLIGEDPCEIEKLWERMYQAAIYIGRSGPVLHAMSAIDIALWDLYGKINNKPMTNVFGGKFHDKILAYASALMPESPLDAARMAESYVDRGYKAIKFGWGPIGKDDKDIERVAEIRRAVGDDVKIMIDAGTVWDAKTAIKMAKAFEQLGVYWLEEPLPADDLDGYAQLSESVDLFIATGEQEAGRLAFSKVLDEGKVDIIQPDVGRCGGLTEMKRIAYLAYDRNKKVVPHAFKSGITLAASVHLVSSIPHGYMVEYTVSDSPLTKELVSSPVQFKDGYVSLTNKPGLGIELNEEIVEKYMFRKLD